MADQDDNPRSEMSLPAAAGKPKSAVTDSPWYWVLVFSLMALFALLVISHKYSRRQAGIERQYQARERIVEKRAAENNPADGGRIDNQDARRPFATPGNQLIPIWPLAILLVAVAAVAAVMLFRASRAVPGPD